MLTFLKAQMSSLAASVADFLITVVLVEFTGTRVIVASVEGTISGGIVNFIINKAWVFNEGEKKAPVKCSGISWSGQAIWH